jgi:selenide,water dikinase
VSAFPPRLTAFSHGAGCACKLSPAELAMALSRLPAVADDDLLVGAETRDDAAAYRLTPDLAIVVTADFITPVVDDPEDFGAIAATNAISDVYAMGGEPLLALNLVGFPREALEIPVLQQILAAGGAVALEAGMLVVGGHTIDDPELKYGMSVVGRVHPDRLLRNSAGRAGDLLYLTKALGVGILTTAAKRDAIDSAGLSPAVASMRTSNRDASRVSLAAGVVAATDVTGFGLLGHLNEMAAGSGLAAVIEAAALPILPLVEGLAREGVVPGGTERNLASARNFTVAAGEVADWQMLVAADAQTSGGLLVAVQPGSAAQLEREMAAAGVNAVRVGRLEAGEPGRILVT